MSDEELKGLFEGLRQENAADRAATRQQFDEMRQENAAAHAETRRHFDVTAERLETKFDTLAETVGHLDERLGREVNRLEEKMDRGFADTQAMIKFSHAELLRRVSTLEVGQRSLEETVADLQSRLERLESSTH
jgi:chaperonin cofactor prefoldin